MVNVFKVGRWSPYLVGALIGILSWVTFGLMGEALGASTTAVRAIAAAERAIAPAHVDANPYYTKLIGTATDPRAVVDWQFALVLMMAVGALIAARLSGSSFREHVPRLWEWRFGPSRGRRYLAAFAGGAIMLFGARLAGGCTSGHALSGGLQLAVSSWMFLISMFAAGVATAFAMFGKEGPRHV
jgi:hypothetical protein